MKQENIKLSKEDKKKIKQFIKQKQYDEVFYSYGRKAYMRYVPEKEREKLLRKYADEGRYEDIYLRFGERRYNSFLVSATFDEIKMTKGLGHAIFWKTKHDFFKSLKAIGLMVALSATSLPVATGVEIAENSVKYSDEIQAYIDKNQDYADEIRQLGLNDLETFMLVTYDMWENIQGYKTPQKDITGFLELDLSSEDGYGVCRNMAKDVQKKLNMINPRYNARTIIVQTNTDQIKMPNIRRNIIREKTEETYQYGTIFTEFYKKIAGNHEIVLVDISGQNITLALDPTNPAIGVYSDGKIIILNPTRGDNTYDIRGYNTIQQDGNISEIGTIASDYIKSYIDSGITLDEAREMYGLDAQQFALDSALGKRMILSKEFESFDDRIYYKVDRINPEESNHRGEKGFEERY